MNTCLHQAGKKELVVICYSSSSSFFNQIQINGAIMFQDINVIYDYDTYKLTWKPQHQNQNKASN